MSDFVDGNELTGIAIVGMAGRFPRARTVDEFWRNLRDGVDCISYFRDDELEAANPEDLKDPSFVKARGVLEDEELFDARFFEVPPLQAELMDPQHRFFLECAAHALEDAGYDPERVAGTVGVFGGVTLSSYFLNNLLSNPDLLRKVGSYQVVIGTDRDYLTTLASYKLNLKGPSLNVQTACSTSLVATVLACQSLLSYNCDMALAGGVSIKVPQRSGYFYQPGGLDSSDGRCRAFDAKADGSVYGSGVGVVVLKRLEDAIADGDAIHGVLVGAAMNNDGSAKVGFTAPGVDGQADVIATAQALAGVDPATIGFVECHGTGTALGDPIEVAALTKAFRAGNPDLPKNYCALGSVKTNIGHCAAAAGVSGLIKAVLAVKNRQIPPNLHFERPNPAIDFANSPFYVSDRLREWETDGAPRRAGVSSFGLGGTNAHVVIQEAPEAAPSGPSRPWQILVLSAKSEASLEAATGNLAADLEGNPGRPLADVAYTLQMGRRAFPLRRVLVCQETAEAAKALSERDPRRLLSGFAEPGERPVAFLFPGVGDHYPGMARGLYESEPVFREHLDRCAELLSARLGGDLREIILPKETEAPAATGGGMDLRKLLGRGGAPAVESEASRRLNRTLYAQPAVFAIEYALGKLWLSWGLRPEAMLGYSLGEYSAACLAGVLTLEDATLLVAERARLIEGLPAGAMLAVPLPEERVKSLLSGSLDLSAVNAPAVCVVSGPVAEIEAFQNRLGADGVTCRRLPTTHAFHSRMMEPIVPALTELARRVQPHSPEIPVLSNVTGTWMTPAEAADPTYWVRHLCQPVRFAAGVAALWSNPSRVLLEVGPGFGLSTLALQQAAGGDGEERLALPTLRNQHDRRPDQAFLLDALGKLWLAGVRIDWSGFAAGESRRRVRLPLYAFDRQRYWVEPRGGLGLLPRQDATEVPSEAAGQEADAAARRARHARPNLRTAYVEPATETEKRIAGIYQELLGMEKVGAHDSFFELGGHSLLGTQVISRLGRDLGADVPLSRLFELPTPADLAQEIDALTRTSSRVPPIQPVPREAGTHLPLSFAQQRLWFLQRFDLASPAYNLPLALRLSGPADLGALAGAVHEVLRRHEALRTRFPEIQGEPAQVIDPPRLQALPLADLAGLPEAIREAEARRLAVEEARRPFDLAADPLLRVAVLRLGGQEHLLLATQHHIVSDGWSMGVLVREVAALYPALLEGRPSPFPDLPVQYADYAVWQRERLSGERLDAELAWWRERLGGAPVHLELPADRPRSLSESARAGRISATVPAELWQRLTAIAQGAGATAFMTLMTGFQALLGRYTQLDDFLVGTPLANRIRPEIEGLIGFFVNTLVLRADLAGGPSFLAHLARVRESSLAAADHQELPFEQVVEALRPERAPGENPLFQVMMVLQNAPIEAFELPGLTLRGEPVTSGAAKLDLAVQFYETPDGVAGVWEYRTDLFDESTIERAARHFANLLAAAAGEPERAVAELPLLDEGERGQLLAWSGIESRAESRFVHDLIAARAAEIPDRPALVFTGGTWTYAELERRSNLLARRLRDEMGVGPERIVAVGTERTPETVAALLAILKAGGAYLPLDPAYPAERLRYIWEDSGRPPILAPARLLSALPEEIREGWVALETPEDGADPGAPPATGLTPDSLAYVIYTSGSTGRPKGTLLVHRGFANVAVDMARHFQMDVGGRVLQFASFSFDASIMDVFSPLISGAEVHLAAPEELIPGPDLIHLIQQRGITNAILSPSILMASPLEEMPALHTLAVGGEACPPELIGIWGEGRRFLNGYGPTEATVCSTIAEPAPGGGRPPIGRPIANVRAYVLDRRFGMAPAGVPGELCLGGVGVARGYLGRPDLTADRFRPDPFGDEGARLYRSGDLVRWLPSGELDFLGRIDQQVKIRGFRIETGEIESVLARNPAVRAAVVEARPDGGTHRLVAYVVPSNGEVNVSELRGFLRGELPDYMIPAAWVTLDALPINASGKVDRRALPAPGLDRPDLAAGYLAPRDAVEEGLAAIWGRLLGVERVGVRDNFFELGGHSLLAHRVQTAVRESFGVEIELRAIFERPTVEELAVTIAQARGASADEGELAGMLESLEGLSDEEVEALLAAEDEAEEPR